MKILGNIVAVIDYLVTTMYKTEYLVYIYIVTFVLIIRYIEPGNGLMKIQHFNRSNNVQTLDEKVTRNVTSKFKDNIEMTHKKRNLNSVWMFGIIIHIILNKLGLEGKWFKEGKLRNQEISVGISRGDRKIQNGKMVLDAFPLH